MENTMNQQTWALRWWCLRSWDKGLRSERCSEMVMFSLRLEDAGRSSQCRDRWEMTVQAEEATCTEDEGEM